MFLVCPVRELMQARNAIKSSERLPSRLSVKTAIASRNPPLHKASSSQRRHRLISPSQLSFEVAESVFFGALERAISCRRHNGRSKSNDPPRLFARPLSGAPSIRSSTQTRSFQNHAPSSAKELEVYEQPTRDEYIGLLDYYDSTPLVEAWGLHGRESSSDLPLLEEVHHKYASQPIAIRRKDKLEYADQRGRAARAIRDKSTSIERLLEYYQALPHPGVKFLSRSSRRYFLRRLTIPEERRPTTTLRFLSVLDDMKAAGLGISRRLWNSAIHATTRTLTRPTTTEVHGALRMWKEMEQEAGILGSSVTFNILFDVAIKAGEFKLAEMILHEMTQRNLAITRFTRAGLIYYQGLRRDGNGVRRAYQEFVNAGEIVDTMVLNCVIASLVHAGEPVAAENVYHRMKEMHQRLGGHDVPLLDHRATRELGRALQSASKEHRHDKQYISHLQRQQSLAPDHRTFVILIQYHASPQGGELNRIVRLVEEMQAYGIPVRGRIFMELFRGFAFHGGVRYTAWTTVRLSSVWTTFIKLDEEEMKDVYIAKWIVIWILRAFNRCAGPQTALQIWNEVKERWKPVVEGDTVVLRIVSELNRKRLREPRI